MIVYRKFAIHPNGNMKIFTMRDTLIARTVPKVHSTPGLYTKYFVQPGIEYHITWKHHTQFKKGHLNLWVVSDKNIRNPHFFKPITTKLTKEGFRYQHKGPAEWIRIGFLIVGGEQSRHSFAIWNWNIEEFSLEEKKNRGPQMKHTEGTAIVIYTYDRYHLLRNVLNSIKRNKVGQIEVYIFDDASPKKQVYQKKDYKFPIHYHRFSKNHGKKRWHRMIHYILQQFKLNSYDHFIFMADDMPFVKDGIQDAIKLYDSIKDPRKIAMNIDNNRGMVQNWTKFRPKKYNEEVWLVNWVDMAFICSHKFLQALNFGLHGFDYKFPLKQAASSGVGRHISLYLHRRKWRMYMPVYSLVKHLGNQWSKMNPLVRRKQKLVSRLKVNKSLSSAK